MDVSEVEGKTVCSGLQQEFPKKDVMFLQADVTLREDLVGRTFSHNSVCMHPFTAAILVHRLNRISFLHQNGRCGSCQRNIMSDCF